MNLNERNRYDAFVRIDVFGAESVADFTAASKGKLFFDKMKSVVERLNETGADQSSAMGDSRQSHASKGTARENMRRMLSAIARTAEGAAYDIPGLEDKFRVPVNRNDQEMLAVARSFLSDAAAYEEIFVKYELDEDFLEELEAAIEAFAQTLTTTGAARGEQVASTTDIGETVREGMIVRRQLDVVVRNKYKNNPAKLAAWESASHIEHPKKKKKNEPPA